VIALWPSKSAKKEEKKEKDSAPGPVFHIHGGKVVREETPKEVKPKKEKTKEEKPPESKETPAEETPAENKPAEEKE
jgi:hypothetical protein